MRNISLRKCNGIIPFISSFYIPHSSSSSIRYYSSSVKGKVGIHINVENEVKCLDDALTLFNRMVRMNPLPSVPVFCQLLKTTSNMKYYSSVISIFRKRTMLGIPINEFVLNILINSYCLMHRADFGFSVLSVYLKNGISFNCAMFNTLLKGLFAENKVKDGVELFKKLVREEICEPNEVMYATVMNGLSKRGYTEKTLSLLRLMERGRTKPDIVIYSIVIDALCKDEKLDAAIGILDEMKRKGICPDIVTYSSLMDGLCKSGQWEKVKNLFSEMVSLNIHPNVLTYNIVMDGLCKEGKVEYAEEVMEHMVRKGVQPDVFTYNVIMDGYCLRGQVDRARRVFGFMIDKKIEPHIISYNILINGYCKEKKIVEAMQLFHEISQKRSKPDIVTYNTIIQGLFEVGR